MTIIDHCSDPYGQEYVLIALEWNHDHNCMHIDHCSDPYGQEYVLIALEWNHDHNCMYIDHCSDPYEQENGTSQDLFDSEVTEVRPGVGVAPPAEHMLWVDKYSPRHYTELLSDDVS